MITGLIFAGVILLIYFLSGIRVIDQYEKSVVLHLGSSQVLENLV